MKASTQISAQTDFTYTYQNNLYGFYVTDHISDLPSTYSFNSDVIEYVIEGCGKGFNYQIAQQSGIRIVDGYSSLVENAVNSIFGLVVNAYTATASFINAIFYERAQTYAWDFACIGYDPYYSGWDQFGPAYSFEFTGICGDKMTLVLDSTGNFYGSTYIGNYVFSPNENPFVWIGEHNVDPNDPYVYAPSYSVQVFENLKQPYIDGIKLHFFQYESNNTIENHFVVNDFRDTSLRGSITMSGNYKYYNFLFISNHYMSGSVNGSNFSFINSTGSYTINNENLNISNQNMHSSLLQFHTSGNQVFSCVLPYYKNPDSYYIGSYDVLGIYNNDYVDGHSNIYLKTFSYTPTITPVQIPEEIPIPITEIPEDPDDPLPNNPTPDPVPGETYPNPDPLPLPPFASIVSGNDELWGVTLDFDGAQNSLLPYLNSLATFEFPSFDDLISDFSGSIIWVAQLMSVLYNGTSFNILFVVLCLFSLVSIIIGGYKLWTTTEPDPNNPGFRRTKRPPKGPKGRRRR